MVQLDWIKDLPPNEKEEFIKSLRNSKIVLDKLREIVYNRGIKTEDVKSVDYDSPSWSHKQAHQNGKREAFQEVIKLLEV